MSTSHPTKRCSHCKTTKPVADFHRHRGELDGRQPQCKTCRSRHAATHYVTNKDAITNRNAMYVAANKERVKKRAAVYFAANKDAIAKRHAAYRRMNEENLRKQEQGYRLANKELVKKRSRLSRLKKLAEYKKREAARRETNREARKQSGAHYRAGKKEAIKKKNAAYRRKNNDTIKKRRAAFLATEKGREYGRRQTSKRRAMQAGATIGDPKLIAVWERTWRTAASVPCHWCGKKFPGKDCQADHLIPIAKGGSHEVENLVIACERCNKTKSDMLPEIFNATLEQPLLFW